MGQPNFGYFTGFSFETKEKLKIRYEKRCSRVFFPGGITTRKNYFTPDELVDIYIKGNNVLYDSLKNSGFGDEDFARSKDEWVRAIFDSGALYESPKDLQERRNAFILLVSKYLDVCGELAKIGWSAFSNRAFGIIDDLISSFENLTANHNLSLYYKFFTQIEILRQNQYDLSFLCKRGNALTTYAEDKAFCLESINRAKRELKSLAQQIEACNDSAADDDLPNKEDNDRGI